jgi:hypothetical protein
MPVSKKYKAVMIHVPKNAGTAIMEAMEMEFTGHRKWSYYAKQKELRDYLSFAIVRNPLDRLVSNYEYAKLEKSFWHSSSGDSRAGKHRDYDFVKTKSFAEVVDVLYKSPRTLKHQGWKSQKYWLCNFWNKIMVDRVLKFENLNNEFHELFPDVKLESVNKSKSKIDFMDYYNDDLLKKAKSIYKKDFELFGY